MNAFVGIGAYYLDTILEVDSFPKEDEKMHAVDCLRRGGGNVMNTLNVLGQLVDARKAKCDVPLPMRLYAVAVLPTENPQMHNILQSTMQSNISVDHCIYKGNSFAHSCIIQNRSTGSRTIISHSTTPEMTFDEFIRTCSSIPLGKNWFHFEGRNTAVTLECINYLHLTGLANVISVEIEKPGRAGLAELSLMADVAFFSRSYAMSLGFETAEAFLTQQSVHQQRTKYLCCTWGASGAVMFDRANNIMVSAHAYPDPSGPPLDTTGAGDTFIAGMIYCMRYFYGDGDILTQLDFANRLAGFKVMQKGYNGLGQLMSPYL